MLPEWDFGGDDAKRRAFIDWVWAELDRYDDLTTVAPAVDHLDWTAILVPGVKSVRPVGRPGRKFDGINGMVRDYLLIRYMFGRYWPRRRRREDDAASAINIAVARNVTLPRSSVKGDVARLTIYHEAHTELKSVLKRGVTSVSLGKANRGGVKRVKSIGRKQAEADIALLDALPSYYFTNNITG